MRTVALLLVLAGGCPRPDPVGDDTDPTAETFDDDLGVTCLPDAVPLPSPPTPIRSFPFLPTSNGWVSAQYAIDAVNVAVTRADGTRTSMDQSHQLVTFTDHLPANPTEGTWTRDLLWDLYLGVRVDGAGTWLNTVEETDVGYVEGTGIVRTVQQVGDLTVTTRYFAPFHGGATRDLVVVATVRNDGASATEASLYSLQNAHAGGEGSADGEQVFALGEGILEERGDDQLLHTPLDTPTALAAAPGGDDRNPWMRLTSGADLDGSLVAGDDVAAGFQWDLSLDPGEEATRGLVLSWGEGEDLAERVPAFVAGRDAETILAAEEADWDAFHAIETPPDGITEEQLAVFRQSTAVLRMGQVRETGPGYGQILASLPPGSWNISWPRDAAYAIVGLVRANHQEMAKAALDFQIEGDAGYYASYLGIDDYLISAARYYGDGTEESDGAWCPDGSDAGPNVELDDFGLFLWAYGEYARANPDDSWVDETLPMVLDGVADPLVALIDGNNDLLVADSSIWERHWYECFPNGRKQFTYSSIMAVAGLRYAAELSGDATYEQASTRLRSGLLGLASDGGPVLFDGESGCPFVASAPEETCDGCGPIDGAVVELVNHEVVRPASSAAVGTMRALRDRLQMQNGSPGFLRNDDGTGTTNPYPWYDDQEWVVIDLRMAVAFHKVGEATGEAVWTENAHTLVDWVTVQAQANHGLIAELLSDGVYSYEDEYDNVRSGMDLGSEYQGAVPMCGFGPGAYILALEELYE